MPDVYSALARCYRRTGTTGLAWSIVRYFAGAAASVCWASDPPAPHPSTFMAIAAGWPATNSRHGEDSIREKRQTHGRGAGAVSIDNNHSVIATLDECSERDSTRCAPSSTLVCGCRRPMVKAQDPWDGISHEPRAQLNQLARASQSAFARDSSKEEGVGALRT